MNIAYAHCFYNAVFQSVHDNRYSPELGRNIIYMHVPEKR